IVLPRRVSLWRGVSRSTRSSPLPWRTTAGGGRIVAETCASARRTPCETGSPCTAGAAAARMKAADRLIGHGFRVVHYKNNRAVEGVPQSDGGTCIFVRGARLQGGDRFAKGAHLPRGGRRL